MLRKYSPPSIFLILLGALSWSLTMTKSGLVYPFGMGFWGPNGHDGIWHIALSTALAKGSWQMPIFTGELIKNYHIGFDLLLAVINKFTLIPTSSLYFQISPPVFALVIGLLVYWLIYDWTNSDQSAFWATFFVYFGGNWGWIISLIKIHRFGGESIFWSQQSISTLINPPFALSLIVVLLGLIFMRKGLKTKDIKYFTIATFLFGTLIQIKVYAGILTLAGLLIAGTWRFFKRQGITLIKIFTGALVISILLFTSTASDIGKTVIFKPFWFLETMMQFSDRVGWQKFGSAMINYKLSGNVLKEIPTYIFAFMLFWFGNLGTRLIKEIKILRDIKKFKHLDYLDIFFFSVIVIGIVAPMFFVQTGTPWNTIQFFYYSLFISGILAGVTLGNYVDTQSDSLFHRKEVKILVVAIVVIFTLPTTLSTLIDNYLPSRPPAKITTNELQALDFLAKQPDGVVLTIPFSKEMADRAIDEPPRPLYLYESTAYVSAISGKKTYIEDEVNLEITGYAWRDRVSKSEDYLKNNNVKFLYDNNISYIYMVNPLNTYFKYRGNLHRIFSNGEVDIYKVN